MKYKSENQPGSKSHLQKEQHYNLSTNFAEGSHQNRLLNFSYSPDKFTIPKTRKWSLRRVFSSLHTYLQFLHPSVLNRSQRLFRHIQERICEDVLLEFMGNGSWARGRRTFEGKLQIGFLFHANGPPNVFNDAALQDLDVKRTFFLWGVVRLNEK